MRVRTERIFEGDKVLWILIGIIMSLSILSAYSSFIDEAKSTGIFLFHSTTIKHFIFLGLGLLIMIIAHKIPLAVYSTFASGVLIASVFLILYTVLFGPEINGAQRSIKIGPMYIQTFDFAKVGLILFIARLLSKNHKNVDDHKKVLLPSLIAIITVGGIIYSEDFSTAFLIGMAAFIMLYIGNVQIVKVLLVTVSVIAIVGIVVLIFTPDRASTRSKRLDEYIEKNIKGNYNTVNPNQVDYAAAAVGTAGIFGKGPGKSKLKYTLPLAFSDYIFAISVEEYGIIISTLVILLYIILLYRAGYIARKTNSFFGALLAIGLALIIVLQAFAHIAVTIGMVPSTGLPLPFVSSGGVSIIFMSLGVGIILRASIEVDEETVSA